MLCDYACSNSAQTKSIIKTKCYYILLIFSMDTGIVTVSDVNDVGYISAVESTLQASVIALTEPSATTNGKNMEHSSGDFKSS